MENGAVVPPSSRILQPTILITILRLMVKTPSTLSGEASFKEEVMLTKTSNAKREAI